MGLWNMKWGCHSIGNWIALMRPAWLCVGAKQNLHTAVHTVINKTYLCAVTFFEHRCYWFIFYFSPLTVNSTVPPFYLCTPSSSSATWCWLLWRTCTYVYLCKFRQMQFRDFQKMPCNVYQSYFNKIWKWTKWQTSDHLSTFSTTEYPICWQ